mmetsp:Transcript_22208/g.61719  ORF Transcript_22208/g.61719 Transcript_22208/m.61719 type:complete len:108 (-) Transcript_22208:310-633(-)
MLQRQWRCQKLSSRRVSQAVGWLVTRNNCSGVYFLAPSPEDALNTFQEEHAWVQLVAQARKGASEGSPDIEKAKDVLRLWCNLFPTECRSIKLCGSIKLCAGSKIFW